nr:BTB/POZ domain-containing protein At5g66560-like [Oryza sativa Japonica Group]
MSDCHIMSAQPPGGRATDSSLEWEPVKDDALVYVRVELTAWNVAPLRCAAEYLEMTEEHAEDNLTARVEAYLEQAVLRHSCEATKALKSREELLPHAEELGIVSRCVEAISIFTSGTTAVRVNLNEEQNMDHLTSPFATTARSSAASRSWFDDLAVLGLDMYRRVMAAMAARADVRTEARESCLVSYARGTITALSRSMRRLASAPASSEVEQRDLLEAVVTSVPTDKCSGRVVTAKFLFAQLWTAHILLALDAALGQKAATQLEHATLEDVLIPSYSGGMKTLYDVDCVERVVRYF